MILPILLGVNNNLASASKGYVEFELQKATKSGADQVNAVYNKHDDSNKVVSASLANKQVFYQIQLEIGTPPQLVDFTIDTGSSDLWVMSSDNPFCTNDPNNSTGINCTGSIFDPALSSTFKGLNSSFEIAYGDTTRAYGEMAKDNIGIGGQKLYNATFAVANVSNATTCVFGIGFIGDEASAVVHKNSSGVFPTYFNVPTLMKHQNLIHTNAYSLWLNDANAESGSILFGAIDKTKYEGDLYVMPVYNNYHEYLERPIQTRVMLNGLSVDNKPLVDFNIAVLLDSGTSFAYLPEKIVHSLGKALGFTFEDTLGYYYGGLDTAHKNMKEVILNFSGAKIPVDIDNLLVALTEDDGSPLIMDNEEQVILAIGIADENYMNILGDVFLRGIYTVFDLDHYEIAVAKAKVNVTDSEIVLIEASIPGAIQVPGYVHTTTNNVQFYTHPYTAVATGPVATGHVATLNATSIPTAPPIATPLVGGSVTTSPHTSYIAKSSSNGLKPTSSVSSSSTLIERVTSNTLTQKTNSIVNTPSVEKTTLSPVEKTATSPLLKTTSSTEKTSVTSTLVKTTSTSEKATSTTEKATSTTEKATSTAEKTTSPTLLHPTALSTSQTASHTGTKSHHSKHHRSTTIAPHSEETSVAAEPTPSPAPPQVVPVQLYTPANNRKQPAKWDHKPPQAWVEGPDGELMTSEEYNCRYGSQSNGRSRNNRNNNNNNNQGSGCCFKWLKKGLHRSH